MEILDIILPIVYIVVGLALIWFVIELVITIKKVRTRAIDTIDELQPSIKNIESMVEEIQPTITKVDPLVDRVTLTVDSVNLELMRVDGILDDVSNITGTVSKTMNTVDSVASAPLDIVTSVTKKVRKKFSPKYASDQSVNAGAPSNQKVNPIAQFADTAIDAAGEAFKEQQVKSQERKDAQNARVAKRDEKNDRMDDQASRLADKILDDANVDAPAQPEPETPTGVPVSDDAVVKEAADTFMDENPASAAAAAETFIDSENVAK